MIAAVRPDGPPERLVFFDGHCALCDRAVTWIMRRDRHRRFRFAPLASQAAQRWLSDTLPAGAFLPDSLVYLRMGRMLVRSNAVIQVAIDLGWPWRIAALGLVFPRPLRDAAYDLLARYRHRWFGRRTACRVPSPQERDLFLD